MGTANSQALDFLVNVPALSCSDDMGILRFLIGRGEIEGRVEGRASGDEGYQLHSI